MNFFGVTSFGPQNYIKDSLNRFYQEPMTKGESESLILNIIYENNDNKMKERQQGSKSIEIIDCNSDRINGFAFGSSERFIELKRKGIVKTVGPSFIYRLPVTTSMEYGWWHYDSALSEKSWHETLPRYPQPTSPNTLILNTVRKNNKYATLF